MSHSEELPSYLDINKVNVGINFSWLGKVSYFMATDFSSKFSEKCLSLVEKSDRHVIACDSVPSQKVTDRSFRDGMKHVYHHLKSLGVNIFWEDGYSANDILFAATRNTMASMDSCISLVAGSDRLRPLLRNGLVSMHCVHQGKLSVVTESYAEMEWGVDRDWFREYLILVGDKDMPGMKGIGPVKAREIIYSLQNSTEPPEGPEKMKAILDSELFQKAHRGDPVAPEGIPGLYSGVDFQDMQKWVLNRR